jgi:hypothetical protein
MSNYQKVLEDEKAITLSTIDFGTQKGIRFEA